jgi:hypothetical protein
VLRAARAIAFGRLAFGAGALIAPRLVVSPWLGADGRTDGATVLTRSLAVRDLLLGFMTLHTLDTPEVASGLQATLAACDAVDGLATLAARRSGAVVALALGTAAAELAIARQLRPAAFSAAAQPPGADAPTAAGPQA